ncbi:iron ABC transporter permease [bacterium]|nr:MAG: iron ABC transporter permease [bacterium]
MARPAQEPSSGIIKTCPLCEEQFECAQGRPGCWCETVVLERQTLAEIRAVAYGCVCPNCLSSFALRESVRRSGDGDGVDGSQAPAKAPPDIAVRSRGVSAVWAPVALGFLAGALLLGLGTGAASIGPASIIASLLAHIQVFHVSPPLSSVDDAILWQIRAPRVVLAALVGGMLAVAGSAYQGVFRNPLADPYLLGVAAGAGLGATLAIAYTAAGTDIGMLLPLAAFAGALIAVIAAYVLGRSAGGVRGTSTLILAGVIVALFMTAIQTFVQQQRSDTLRAVYSWILGGFGTADWHSVVVVVPYIAVSSVIILLHRRVLDVLSLGDEEAASLGIDVRRARLVIVLVATAGTAAAVAVSGLIGFVGIIIPHTIRLLVSPSYRAIVPLSLLAGAGFLILADALARTILSPAELPIGVVTAFFGAPFFAILLRTSRRTVM